MGNSLDNLSRATQVGTDKEHPGYYSRNDNMPSSGDRRASLEKALKKFVDESTKRNVATDEMLMKYDAKTKAAMKNHASSIKNLENQIDHLARAVEARLDGASTCEFGKVQVNAIDDKFNGAQIATTTLIANQDNILPRSGLSFVEQVEVNKPIVEALKKDPKCLKGLEEEYRTKRNVCMMRAKIMEEKDDSEDFPNLDKYSLESMEDFVDLNPNDGFLDEEEEEFQKKRVSLNERYTSAELLENMHWDMTEENVCKMRAKIMEEIDESGLVQVATYLIMSRT
ncbi:hypothetical protein Tco_1305753 [Tanacetum coccineum]